MLGKLIGKHFALFILLGLAIASCTAETTTHSYPNSSDEIDVTYPTGSTVFSTQDNLFCSWSGGSGSSVSIQTYKDNKRLNPEFHGSTANDGHVNRSPAPSSWGTGDNYYLLVEDSKGNYGYSRVFSIKAPQPMVNIAFTSPNASSVYSTDDIISCEWSGAIGDRIKVEIYKGNVLLSPGFRSYNSNSGQFDRFIEDEWGTGKNFRLKLTDDEDNFGWSEYFTITDEIVDPPNLPNPPEPSVPPDPSVPVYPHDGAAGVPEVDSAIEDLAQTSSPDSADAREIMEAMFSLVDTYGYDTAKEIYAERLERFVDNGGDYQSIVSHSNNIPAITFDEFGKAVSGASRRISADAPRPANVVLFVNGVLTDYNHYCMAYKKVCDVLRSQQIENQDFVILGFHNPSYWYLDLQEVQMQKFFDLVNSPQKAWVSTRLESRIQDCLSDYDNLIVIAHSQGNFYTASALDKMSPEIRDHSNVIQLGSPASDWPELRNNVKIYANGDGVADLATFHDISTVNISPSSKTPWYLKLFPPVSAVTSVIDLLEAHSLIDTYLGSPGAPYVRGYVEDWLVDGGDVPQFSDGELIEINGSGVTGIINIDPNVGGADTPVTMSMEFLTGADDVADIVVYSFSNLSDWDAEYESAATNAFEPAGVSRWSTAGISFTSSAPAVLRFYILDEDGNQLAVGDADKNGGGPAPSWQNDGVS